MRPSAILKKITARYIASRDFNGLPVGDIGGDHEEVRRGLRELILTDKISLNFGDRHPNPHILAFEPEAPEEQVAKLERLVLEKPKSKDYAGYKMVVDTINCCAYPSKSHLRTVVDAAQYGDRPYTLLLSLGEPQLAYRAFNLRVLEFYRNDPRYHYDADDINGRISARSDGKLAEADDTFLETFGFAYSTDIKVRYVAVFLRYLAGLTPEHQQRWKLDEAKGETFLHPDYAQVSAGFWPENDSIFNAFCEEIRLLNEMTTKIYSKPLFRKTYSRENKPVEFGFLIRPTKKEYEAFVHLLDKMMSDNLNKKFFDGKLPLVTTEEKDGVVTEQQKGTITLLSEWLANTVRFSDPAPKDEMIEVFKEVRKLRGPLAHEVGLDEWDDSYFATQRELIRRAYDAMRTLRLIFANHPLARSVEVPDWLYKGQIRTF